MDNVEKACSTSVVPLTLIRKYARTSWRWMEAYRRKWSPALTTFAAKSYHGHRGVPASMDRIIEELQEHRRHKAADRGRILVEKDKEETRVREIERSVRDVDLAHVDPAKLIGLPILKEFDGFGVCRGVRQPGLGQSMPSAAQLRK